MSAPAASSRAVAARLVLVVLVVLASVWVALDEGQAGALVPNDEEVTPLPSESVRCRFAAAEALAHARSVEQMATARWERVPFALREAPRAVLQMAEAEACYESAGEREGRMRSGAKRRAYEADVLRRFAHARLLLHFASIKASATDETDTNAKETLAQRELEARRQVAALLALLDRAPSSAVPFRKRLEQIDRVYAARAAERARQPKEQP